MLTRNIGTLTVQGIPWCYLKHNGRVAFGFGHHAILFEPCSGYYQIKELGETVFAARSACECLENASEIVFDFYAAQIVPSWERN